MTKKKYDSIASGVAVSYDRAASEYYKLFHDELIEHDYDRNLLDDFALITKSGGIVCDMGCGPSAENGFYLAQKGFNVIGIDISKVCINHAMKITSNIKYICADMTSTPLESSSVDGIISFYSLFHIPVRYQDNAFKEFNRILKSNAKLLIVNHAGKFKKTIRQIWNNSNMELFAEFSSQKTIAKMLYRNGFAIIKNELKESYYDFPKQRVVVVAEKC